MNVELTHRNDRAMPLRRENPQCCPIGAHARSASCELRLLQVANCAGGKFEKPHVRHDERKRVAAALFLADTAMATNLAAG